MAIKQLYPNFGHNVDPDYYQQSIDSFSSGYCCHRYGDRKIVMQGSYVQITTSKGNSVNEVIILEIVEHLLGMRLVFAAYDPDIGGTIDDVYFMLARGVCALGHCTLLSDPNIKLGGNDFWNSYLIRCKSNELSVVTLDPTHREIINSTPWEEISRFDQCNGPNKVIRIELKM